MVKVKALSCANPSILIYFLQHSVFDLRGRDCIMMRHGVHAAAPSSKNIVKTQQFVFLDVWTGLHGLELSDILYAEVKAVQAQAG